MPRCECSAPAPDAIPPGCAVTVDVAHWFGLDTVGAEKSVAARSSATPRRSGRMDAPRVVSSRGPRGSGRPVALT
jgi:hypothetical protein